MLTLLSSLTPTDTFILEIIAGETGQKAKRAQQFVGIAGGVGITVDSRDLAQEFSSAQTQVFGAGGQIGFEKADLGTGYTPFRVSSNPDYKEEFFIEIGGQFQFRPQDAAGVSLDLTVSYCQTPAGLIYDVLTVQPDFTCESITLVVTISTQPPS